MFEGLFPEPFNERIMRLLFHLAHWHSLAKLRLHTDSTLNILADMTTIVGAEVRHFVNHTCPAFRTLEVPREQEARLRRGVR